MPQLETFLIALQKKLAAPKDALLKARELQFAAKGIYRTMAPEEKAAIQRYLDVQAAMQQRLTEGKALVTGEQAAVAQQAEARAAMLSSQADAITQQAEAQAGMLTSQAAQAGAQGQEAVQGIQGQLAALPTPRVQEVLSLAYMPAAAGTITGAVTGNTATGAAVAGVLSIPGLLSRALMTPKGQEIVGKILEGSGGIWSQDALVVLSQVLRDPVQHSGLQPAGKQIRSTIGLR